jgi:hypothetical protein
MRSAILLLLIPALILAQQASLEGTAVDRFTGQPLSGVHIMLITVVMDGGITGAYGAVSDRAGHFSIATVRPATYLLLCDRTGYLHAQLKDTGLPNLTLKPGQQLKDFKIEMTPRAILSGRVLDENADPLQGAIVEPVALPPESMSFTQMINNSLEGGRSTDDRGEFRLIVVPGRYYVKATARGNAGGRYGDPGVERRNDGSIVIPYVPTFYPSTAVKGRATILEAAGGRETSGLEIHLTRQQGLSITGVVSGIPDGSSGVAVQIAELREGRKRISNSHGYGIGRDGKFSFNNLEPGTYRVSASFRSGKTQLNSDTAEVTLGAFDPPPLTLVLHPAAEIRGTLVFEDDSPGAPAQKYIVRLEPAGETVEYGGDCETDSEKNFQLGTAAGKYHVRVNTLPENAYVKSLEVNGTAVASDLFELPDGSRDAHLKIIVSRGGAQISGRVRDAEGDRLLTPLAIVALMSGPTAPDVRNTGVAPDGRYSFKGVRPGKYRLLGINPFEMAIMNDDEAAALAGLFERGEEVELREGDRITKDLKLLPKGDANAKK